MRSQIENAISEKSSLYVQHEPRVVRFDQPTRTRQEFTAECDINNILAQYEKHGVISHVDQRVPVYLDCTDVPDLQSAINLVQDAERAFMSLPASVRKEFDNDPVRFAGFASDPANIDQMREWGLAKPKEAEPDPVRVEVVSPAPTPPPAS